MGIYLWFKIYFLIDTNAKMWAEITDIVVFRKKLLKFLQGVLVQFASLMISTRYHFVAPNYTEVKDGCGKAGEWLFLKQSTDTVALKPSTGISISLNEWYQCHQNDDLCPL